VSLSLFGSDSANVNSCHDAAHDRPCWIVGGHRAHKAEDSVNYVVRFAQPRSHSFQVGFFVRPNTALHDCILYLTHHVYEPGILPGAATCCIPDNVYLRSNLSRTCFLRQPIYWAECMQPALEQTCCTAFQFAAPVLLKQASRLAFALVSNLEHRISSA